MLYRPRIPSPVDPHHHFDIFWSGRRGRQFDWQRECRKIFWRTFDGVVVEERGGKSVVVASSSESVFVHIRHQVFLSKLTKVKVFKKYYRYHIDMISYTSTRYTGTPVQSTPGSARTRYQAPAYQYRWTS